MIAILDVDYRVVGARAACVTAESWDAASPSATFVADIETIQEYEPGAFYRRELPCLLQVLGQLPASPAMVVIDGYVWLSDSSRPGLGARLFEALGARTPVVGIAKTAFHGAESCPIVAKVQRGESTKPLFVTSIGVDLEFAASLVRGMAGPHRIPALLTATDQLSRSTEGAPQNAGPTLR